MARGPERARPVCAWLSLALPAVPVLYLVLLLSGGGSSGFAAWNDVGLLFISMGVSAGVGLGLSLASSWRGERSRVNVLAVIVHGLFLLALVAAFNQ